MLQKLIVLFGVTQIGADVASLYNSKQNGDGTYYGPIDTGNGNCAFRGDLSQLNQFSQISKTIALNQAQYESSLGCGVCVTMQGTGTGSGANPISATPFTAVVIDQCPECSTGDLDLNEVGDGRWGISWQAIACPVGDQSFEYMFEGSNANYLKVQVRNTLVPVSTFKLYNSMTDSYEELTRSTDNFFVTTSGSWNFGTGVVDFQAKLTSIFGEEVSDAFSNDPTNTDPMSGSAQFTKSSAASLNSLPNATDNNSVGVEDSSTSDSYYRPALLWSFIVVSSIVCF